MLAKRSVQGCGEGLTPAEDTVFAVCTMEALARNRCRLIGESFCALHGSNFVRFGEVLQGLCCLVLRMYKNAADDAKSLKSVRTYIL